MASGIILQRLLHRYWDEQVVVLKAGKIFGQMFGTYRGVTQGNPVSPKIFNVVVDVAVRVVLKES